MLRYRRYGPDLLLLELVNASTAETPGKHIHGRQVGKEEHKEISGLELGQSVQDVWESLKAYLLALGDDVQMKQLEHYVAFRRLKNFACVRVLQTELQIWTRLDPSSVILEDGFTRDVTHVGHLGTGNLEIRVETVEELEKAKLLLLRGYQHN